MIFDALKLKQQIGELKVSLQEMTTDRDAQIAKLTEFEQTHKDYIESAQTADQMKQAHILAVETLKAEYETKLTEKDKELQAAKESLVKEVAVVKQEAEQTISTVKDSVAEQVTEQSIRLVASQGTNVVVDSISQSVELTPETAWLQLQSLTGKEQSKFYKQHYSLFESIRMNGSPKGK